MADPMQRRGRWWQQQPDGSWLRWDDESNEWQPHPFPPPPPDTTAPATSPDPISREATTPVATTELGAPTPTPGYQYERGAQGEWWARNERTGELHWYDASIQAWRSYSSATSSRTGERRFAGFWERAGAALIDGVIGAVGSWILGFILGFMMLTEASTSEEIESVSVVASIVGFVGQWLYFAIMESSVKQATLGKMALDLKVTDIEGKRIRFGRATGRYFAKLPSALILGIGFLMVAWDDKKQGLHDKLARTLVYKEE